MYVHTFLLFSNMYAYKKGPSGSGKTTLLDVLAGRGSYQEGLITINKGELCKEMKRSIGYVMQSDLFFEHLSVRDTLTYTALLRLPGTWTREKKIQEVYQKTTCIYMCVYMCIFIVYIVSAFLLYVRLPSQLVSPLHIQQQKYMYTYVHLSHYIYIYLNARLSK